MCDDQEQEEKKPESALKKAGKGFMKLCISLGNGLKTMAGNAQHNFALMERDRKTRESNEPVKDKKSVSQSMDEWINN